MYVILFLSPILMIALGLVNIFKKDWAWRIAELMLRHVKPQRTTEWEHGVTVNGVILIVGGLGTILYILYLLCNSPRVLQGP